MKRKLLLWLAVLLLVFSAAQAVTLPDLTVNEPTALKSTLSAMGIETEDLLWRIPDKCDVVVYDGIPQYPDNGYISVSLKPESTGTSVELTLTDGVWYLPESVTFDVLTKGYYVYFNLGDDLYVYDGLANFYKVGIDGNRLIYTKDEGYSLTMTVSGQGLTARYDLNGALQYYSIPSSDADRCRVYYSIANAVLRAELSVDGTRYVWYADKGWYSLNDSTGAETACSAPAGYESYDADAFAARCPSPNEVLPQPLYGLTKPFTITGPLNYYLREMNLPMYAIDEAKEMGSGVVAENGTVYVEDRQYDKVSFWADNTTFNLTLLNGQWVDPDGILTPDKVEARGYNVIMYRNGRYGSEKICYTSDTYLYSYDIYDLQGNRLYMSNGPYYVIYTNDAGHVVEGHFSSWAGEEHLYTPYYMYKDGDPSLAVMYNHDGSVYGVEYNGKDATYTYTEQMGWYDPYTLDSIDPPPMYADYTLDDFKALCPPEVCILPPTPAPTATPEPTPTPRPVRQDLGMNGNLSVKSGLYVNANDQGIDLETVNANLDRPVVQWVDGMPAVVDDQYANVYIRSELYWDYYEYELQGNLWVVKAPEEVPENALDEGWTVYIHAWYEEASFIDGEELDYVNIRMDDYYLQAYMGYCIWLEQEINGYTIESEFDFDYNTNPLTCYTYNYVENETMHVTYLPSGELDEVSILEHGVTLYTWTPDRGWKDGDSGSSCDTPAGLEYVTEEYITGKYPPIDVIGYVPPEPKDDVPVAKPTPGFRLAKELFLNLSSIGVSTEEILADLPNTDGVVWENGIPAVPDHGYDAVLLSRSLFINKVDMTLTDGVWRAPAGEFTADDFEYSYSVTITIGDWTYLFNNGDLYQVDTRNYLTYYVSGSYVVEYETNTMTVSGSYDLQGELKSYTVTVKSYPDLFINLDTYNNATSAIYYGNGVYNWEPGAGWTYRSWGSDSGPVASDPPEGYEFFNETWIAKNVIPQVNRGGSSTITAPTSYANKLADTLEVIEAEAFLGSSITDCYLPDGVTTIGANAFKNCVELTFIRIPATVKEIASTAFDGCGRVVIVTPEGSRAQTHAEAYGITCITE